MADKKAIIKPHRLTGNKLYKLRTKHGRDKIFADPCLLFEEASKYFEWCDTHPLERTELVKYKGQSDEATVPLGRPYSIDGLTIYLGVSASYFRGAKQNINKKISEDRATEEDRAILETIEQIEQIVRVQNIEGATVGLFSSGIMSRVHGLAENVNTNASGSVGIVVRDKETQDDLNTLADQL